VEQVKLPIETYKPRLEALQRRRKGQHSIRVNDQWRVCFRWSNGDAFDAEVCDYHDE
jgi:proteic killer suppression protein